MRAAWRSQKGKLKVSSIYVWFQDDFGGDAEGLMEHWQQYANPAWPERWENTRGFDARLRLAAEWRRAETVSRDTRSDEHFRHRAGAQ